MKIYDCFTFYNEYELLLWRLKILWDYVDVFVIAEGNRTFQNKPKPFNFLEHRELFADYEKKIRYLPIREEMPYDSDWSIEIYQRNAIKRALAGCQNDDVILLSDVDEFVAPHLLVELKEGGGEIRFFTTFGRVDERGGLRGLSRNLRCCLKNLTNIRQRAHLGAFLKSSPVVCEQKMYNFFMNYQQESNWCGSIIALYGQIHTMQELRTQRNLLPLVQGGWHFTSLGGLQMVRNKMRSTSDGMRNPIYYLTEAEQNRIIESALEKGYIWWSKEMLYKRALDELDIPFAAWFAKKFPQMYHG
ncbi:beta-1,4-N-acetylgalactosaminyltransferase [uncultured Selenomonas sp.]|uniref:beta-1,4-N-acetylgalactosaminyltransferase n=1 Tax=uncultured Selenomonas sp. TaxID=159275 RepID=UPI0028D81481|nr:beta-1,4-N-acetylgalactosaminyltransferase [uncultured Selenomonas sp.]